MSLRQSNFGSSFFLLTKLSVRAKRLGDQVAGARQFDSDDGLFLGFAHVGLYIYVETGTSLT